MYSSQFGNYTRRTPTRSSRTRRLIAAALAPLALAFGSTSAAHAASSQCDKVAAPNGSDSAPGTAGAPLRTAQALADSLSPGQVGCLRAGSYYQDLRVNHGGQAGAPITLQSYPGERARIVGRLYLPSGSSYVTIASLDLDGTDQQGTNQDSLPSPTVDSDHATFVDDDVTNDHTLICFALGSEGYGRATNTVIEHSRIHDCGAVPATNHDHGIYVDFTTGTKILDNVIDDNTDRGIQLYPDAQQTTIEGNVIYGNGEGIIFSGDNGVAANNTRVDHNVVVDSKLRHNVESYYPPGNPVGHSNSVQNNCLYGGAEDPGNGGVGDQEGFSASNNIVTDPHLADPANGNFTVPSDNPCASVLAGAPVATVPGGHHHHHHGAGATGHHGVVLKGSAWANGVVRVKVVIRRLSAASTTRQFVHIEFRRRAKHWHSIFAVRLSSNTSVALLRMPRALRNQVVSMRAVVPSIGRSSPVTLRVRN